MSETVIKHGVPVVEGAISVSDFARNVNVRSNPGSSYFEGSWDELVGLVRTHWESQEPGTGSVDGDVVLVRVPVAGFFTPIVRVTEENEHLVQVEEYVRQEGEKPVLRRYVPGVGCSPAEVVKIVCYRADVLAQDAGRSSDAEWEIITILAQLDEHTPMNPVVMLRNSNHEVGGTFREYSDEEWAEAYAYWDVHAYAGEVSD